jgi:putative SOS response-associated peptidase YedK
MTLTETDPASIAACLEAALAPEAAALYRPRYNVAPSDLHWVVRREEGGGRRLIRAAWGLPRADRRHLINLRSEAAGGGRRDFRERRCVAVADGFFEWTKGRERRPIWFHRPDGGLLLMAGVLEIGPNGVPHFAVFTTPANRLVGRFHDRMPAIVPQDRLGEWLARPAEELMRPAPDDMLVATAVSPLANSPRNDTPEILRPEPTLFPI